MKYRKILSIASKLLNALVPTHNNRYYFRYLENAPGDHYDILNYGGSNMYSIIHYIAGMQQDEPIELFVEYYDKDRLDAYTDIINTAKNNNVVIRFIEGPKYKSEGINFFLEMKNSFYRFSCKYWINESGGTTFFGKLKNQQIICTNYFISCKNDYVKGKGERWNFLDSILTTALLPSQVISSSVGVDLENCVVTGFPRNDTILNSKKGDIVKKWIFNTVGYTPEFVFVYAPTYRDYERNIPGSRPLFGYETPNLQSFLEGNKSVIIYKLHPYHTIDIKEVPTNIIPYKSSYDFTLYDTLAISDCVICDYSSVSYDYMLADKPIVFNLYDINQYEEVRGLSYEPYEMFCPGEIVKNELELIDALNNVVQRKDITRDKRRRLTKVFHKYNDSNSTKRACDFIFYNAVDDSLIK